jgi:hypothetical protein
MRAVKTKEAEHAEALSKEKEQRARVEREREEARRREVEVMQELQLVEAALAREREEGQAAILEKVCVTLDTLDLYSTCCTLTSKSTIFSPLMPPLFSSFTVLFRYEPGASPSCGADGSRSCAQNGDQV